MAKFSFSFFPQSFQSVSFFPKIKHFFSPKQNEIFGTSSGRNPRCFFHSFPAAEKATGLNRQTIRDVLERGNKVYHRKADHKLFHISKEDPILVARIEGEEFFSLEEIQTKLGLSPTRFLNQIKSGKFAKKIDWISDELFPERNQQVKKSDELVKLQEKFQMEISKLQEKIDWLSSKVEKLEALEKEKASRPAEVSPREVFKASGTFSVNGFNIQSLAKFIRNGLVGEIRSNGPKTHKSVLFNNKQEYLPDLVKQIIQDHILPEFDCGTEEEKQINLQKLLSEYNPKATGLSLGAFSALRGQLRRLEPTFILEVSKEVMKLI